MQDYFYTLSDCLCAGLYPGEILLLSVVGETSDFVRFNHAKVRQAGWVQQATLSLDLIFGDRHSTLNYELQRDIATDCSTLEQLIKTLRSQLALMPADPHLLYATTVQSSEYRDSRPIPDAKAISTQVCEAAQGLDLVGLLASGQMYYGFANSLGQRNWHEVSSFHLDWSLHLSPTQAIKANYAGQEWSPATFQTRLEQSRADLAIMARTPITLTPGIYHVYLAPTALYDLWELLGADGFGIKAHRSADTPLLRMTREGRKLHPKITLQEHPAAGLAPLFTDMGFIRPSQVTLINAGAYQDYLVGPRSSREFGLPVTGAETPNALDLAPGSLPLERVPEVLGTGLWINNLWYCNISDPHECRITGMTRFACLWVENGQIQAPVTALRFDDSLYHLLGEQVVDLTQERTLLLDHDTYGGRSSFSANLPGVVVGEMRFTL